MILPDDTIVAIATPLGEGGLGVVRLSGSQAFSIADAIFKSKRKLSTAISHTLHHGWIGKIDEVVAAVFCAPHSYTGEDVVEFSCHGSPVVLKEVVHLCLENGARSAEPGEFTQRAYLNGKLDLLQAEAVADLIHAQSSKARAAAAAQLKGNLSARLNGLREQLITLLAQVEANLDFVEEKLPIISFEEMVKALNKVQGELNNLLSTSVKGRLLREGLRVTLAGKPNVGKSSLFNALLAQDRAIVTNVPGTTRDTLEEKLEWDGMPVVLTDTAGLRTTVGKVERHGTERAKRAQKMSDLVLLVLDGSRPLTQDDKNIIGHLQQQPVVTAFNKCDKKQNIQPQALPDWIRAQAIWISAKTGAGLPDLKRALMNAVTRNLPETEDAVVITNRRHTRHLEKAAEKISEALQALDQKKSEEAVSLDIRGALDNLSAITGENVTDDVLSSIFRQFCIGK